MKFKSQYRPKRPGPETPEMVAAAISEPEPKPEPKLDVRPDDSPLAAAERIEAQREAAPPPAEDEATRALKARIREIDNSTELNRRYQAQMAQMAAAQRPQTREQMLELFRRQGVSDANIEFLKNNPELIDGYELTYNSAMRATQEGHQPDTDDHREATKRIFHTYMRNAQRDIATGNSPDKPAPEFFKPPPAPAPRRPPGKASIVSAPVSRETSASRIYEAEQNPETMTLSAPEVEAAKISGISLREYAQQKLLMQRMRPNGEIEP